MAFAGKTARLGETVEELAAKADVQARARDNAAKARAKAQDKVAELPGQMKRSRLAGRRWPLAVAASVLVAGSVAAGVAWLRRKT